MPTFDTPAPISATIEFDVGSARIAAGERADTVVEVLPSNAAEDADVRAAQQTKVSYADGKLLVKGPKKRSLFGKTGSVDVSVELPAGSDVHGSTPMADFLCTGRLGECRLRTSLGDIRVDEAEAAFLKTGHGDIQAAHLAGDAEVIGAGRIEIGTFGGTSRIKNGNGETKVGEAVGELRVNAANGTISVEVAHAGVDAKSANGGIRVGEVTRGSIALQAAIGDVEVGIRESTAAWLEVKTGVGSVRNSLSTTDGPDTADETVEVRASTGIGDILIHRA
ncbi:DUF4097 family beta strand repeat-containing protein [Streptomyces sp. NPDC050617]|uniref:DUF4097 family beta strand repeat-containing protein n=1 Tax=Streptomyces sp. NPDC050617 TaxID=3154628 RepID=UPI003433717B